MATDTKKCSQCQKELTEEELSILRDVLAGRQRKRIERHNAQMVRIGLGEYQSPLMPPKGLVGLYEVCAACYLNSGKLDEVDRIMDGIIDRVWLHPGVFQFTLVEAGDEAS